MNLDKKGARTASFVLLAFSMIAGTAFSNAFAQDSGMSINVNADKGSTLLTVSGQTALSTDVVITVTSPNNSVISAYQVTPNPDGTYTKEVKTGSFWKQDGRYVISAQQSTASQYQVSVQVEIQDGLIVTTSASESSLDFGTPVLSEGEDAVGLTFTADAPEGATNIRIDGTTERTHTDVTMTVSAPNGDVITVAQTTPNPDGSFSADIGVGCPTWKQDGFYTITVQQGTSSFYKESAEVEIKDCVIVPEFGTIAVLILAVAIISTIAVTTRSRLAMPRF